MSETVLRGHRNTAGMFLVYECANGLLNFGLTGRSSLPVLTNPAVKVNGRTVCFDAPADK